MAAKSFTAEQVAVAIYWAMLGRHPDREGLQAMMQNFESDASIEAAIVGVSRSQEFKSRLASFLASVFEKQ